MGVMSSVRFPDTRNLQTNYFLLSIQEAPLALMLGYVSRMIDDDLVYCEFFIRLLSVSLLKYHLTEGTVFVVHLYYIHYSTSTFSLNFLT